MLFENILFYLLVSPLIGVLLLSILPSREEDVVKLIALNFSFIPFIGFLFIWMFFQKSLTNFQFVTKVFWLPNLNLNLTLGIDGISLFFVLLTTLLIPICILASWTSINYKLKEYLISFLILEFLLIINLNK